MKMPVKSVLMFCLIAALSRANPLKEAPKGMYIFSSGWLSETHQAVTAAGTAISNVNCDGVRWKARWSDIETSPDNYTWQYLDDAVAFAAANNKKCGIHINAGKDCPAWLYAAPYNAHSYTLQDTPGAIGVTIPVPGDPVFMTRWQKFITDFGARYDSNPAVAYIIIAGIGKTDEWDVAQGMLDTAILGSTPAQVDVWKSSSKQIIDFFMSAFPTTTVIGYPVPPFNSSNAAEDPATSMKEVSDYAANMYYCRFGYSVAPLQSSTTRSNYIPANELFLHWTTNPTHGETLYPASSADDFDATLHVALDLRIRGMEIYKVDFENAALQSFTVRSGIYAGQPGGITPRRADMLAIPAPTPCPQSADLKVTVNDSKTAIAAGAQDTYSIRVSNLGPSTVSRATVNDIFPAIFTNVTFTATQSGGASGFTVNGTAVISDTVTMPAGSVITYKAAGRVSPAGTGTLFNVATVNAPSDVPDPNMANNAATDSNTITFRADLRVTVNDGKTATAAGRINTYTIVVTNLGPSNVSSALIDDSFPSTFTGITYTATSSGGALGFSATGGGDIHDTVAMPAGSKIIYKANGRISASATDLLIDTATVGAPGGVTDPNIANNSATDTDTL
jgi:uncharacterized repeat protein (TIGR01451 family)